MEILIMISEENITISDFYELDFRGGCIMYHVLKDELEKIAGKDFKSSEEVLFCVQQSLAMKYGHIPKLTLKYHTIGRGNNKIVNRVVMGLKPTLNYETFTMMLEKSFKDIDIQSFRNIGFDEMI